MTYVILQDNCDCLTITAGIVFLEDFVKVFIANKLASTILHYFLV